MMAQLSMIRCLQCPGLGTNVPYNQFAMNQHILQEHLHLQDPYLCSLCHFGGVRPAFGSADYFAVVDHVIEHHHGANPFKGGVMDNHHLSAATAQHDVAVYRNWEERCFVPSITGGSSNEGGCSYLIEHKCRPADVTFERIIKLMFPAIERLFQAGGSYSHHSQVLNIYDTYVSANVMMIFIRELLQHWPSTFIPKPKLIVIWCGTIDGWTMKEPNRCIRSDLYSRPILLGCPSLEAAIGGGINVMVRETGSLHDRFISFPFNVMVFMGRGTDYRQISQISEGLKKEYKTADDVTKEELDQMRSFSDWTLNVCKADGGFPHCHSFKHVDSETCVSIRLDGYRQSLHF